MTSILSIIFPCLPLGSEERQIQLPVENEKYQSSSNMAYLQPSVPNDEKSRLRIDEAAASFVSAIVDAEKLGPSLELSIQSSIHQAGGWSEYFASKVLLALEAVLKAGKEMNAVLQEAYDKACEAAKVIEGFAADHPLATAVFCTVIAIGILAIIAPYTLEALGFAELGIVRGSWAALWQSTYRGFVPKGSLFSYLQSLGMKLKWKLV